MKLDLADVVLLVLLAVAITAAVASPKVRQWAVAVGLLIAGAFGSKKLGELGDDDETEDDVDPTTDDTPILDPTTSLQTDLDDAHDDVDSLPPDDLADAWAEHGRRADD